MISSGFHLGIPHYRLRQPYATCVDLSNASSFARARSMAAFSGINWRFIWPATGQCPEISAFIPANFNEQKVIFIDLKPFKEALYPKNIILRC